MSLGYLEPIVNSLFSVHPLAMGGEHLTLFVCQMVSLPLLYWPRLLHLRPRSKPDPYVSSMAVWQAWFFQGMLYHASSPLMDGLGTAEGCLAEHLSRSFFLTSVVLYSYASCEHDLWNSGMYGNLSKNHSIVGKDVPFKTVHGVQREKQKINGT